MFRIATPSRFNKPSTSPSNKSIDACRAEADLLAMVFATLTQSSYDNRDDEMSAAQAIAPVMLCGALLTTVSFSFAMTSY